jgi:hypothetical protein
MILGNIEDVVLLEKIHQQKPNQMKTFCLPVFFVVLLLLCTNAIEAQTAQAKLDQVELLKQFMGTWKTEYSKGDAMIL